MHASIHAYDTQLLDPGLIRANIDYISFLMTWLTRLVDPEHAHPAKPIKWVLPASEMPRCELTCRLPLPTEAPAQFRMLPEYLIENISEYLDFLFRYKPDVLENPDKDVLINFFIVFLTPGYINNPFLKAKFVSVSIFSGCQ